MSLIARIKERISLREMARMLGISGLPDRDDVKFRSPLRADMHPSCSIHKERLIDWTRDERLDAIGLYSVVKGISNNDAIGEVAKLAGVIEERTDYHNNGWPIFTAGNKAQAEELCSLRGFSIEGLRLARDRKMLVFARVCRETCWVVTDAERQLAQARRLDGRLFPGYPKFSLDERKAHTLKGSRQGHVLGLDDAGKYDFLLLVEGGPDLIAAHCFIAASKDPERIGTLGILGAGNAFPLKAAEACAGKRVRVFGHADVAGQEAAHRWKRALEAKGVRSDRYRFDHIKFNDETLVIKDLNDLWIHDPSRESVTK